MVVHFHGPYSWVDDKGVDCIATTDLGQEAGLYLWTITLAEGELIYYVGQTGRSFRTRMLEHFKEHMSGGYHLYEPDAFACGEKVMLWPGWYDSERKTTVLEFIDMFSELAGDIIRLAKMYRFYLAPLQCERRLRERIEAGLAYHLYQQDGIIGQAQDKGIRYRGRWTDESPIEVLFQADAALLGLPDSLLI